MTGTSLDGIDVAIVDFNYNGNEFTFKELFFETYNYSDKIKSIILEIIGSTGQIYNISQLNFALSKIYAESVKSALTASGIDKSQITAIGMHGQTLWHQPYTKKFAEMFVSSTLQIGNISALNVLTEIPVIGDFRSADIAAGGQGAPLVPVFDYHFLRSQSENTICLNIGGIANITYLPKGCSKADVIGFDTGPGNMLIDIAAKKYFDKNYDSNGDIARSGKLDNEILDLLMNIDFINKPYPKSTGRETFNVMFVNNYFGDNTLPEDILNTLTHYTAKSIAANIINSGFEVDKVVVSGGGAKNSYLMELIQSYLPQAKVIDSMQLGVGIDSKEAVCFAFLALLNILGLNGNLPSVTGAKFETILGVTAGK
jgi:anhydro-N-acetylmuramic acid kinase